MSGARDIPRRSWTGEDLRGLLAALTVMGIWIVSLAALLTLGLGRTGSAAAVAGFFWMTFLYTGLFITAHDAMHRTVTPHNRALNDAIGWTASLLYALFDFRKVRRNHWAHHGTPMDPQEDPDSHDGVHRGFAAWYLRFMGHYVTVWQIAGMAVVFNVLHHLAGVSVGSLLVFWAGPALASTLQLFYFGTFLPHREEAHDPPGNAYRSGSNGFPVWLSFITCYHFGYHWEHHDNPRVPWWRLPAKRRERLAGRIGL